MIRILFVDDDIDRSQEMTQILNDNEINNECEYSTTKNDALNKLSLKQYDLVIIDLMLPNSMSVRGKSATAGIEILNEICFGKRIIKPLYVMGVTSNEESYDKAKDTFDQSLFPLSIWKDDEEWKMKFLSKVNYLMNISGEYKPLNRLKVDAVFITAVDDEYNALDSLPIEWKDLELENDSGIYGIGTYKTLNGQVKRILKAKLPNMGIAAATYSTTTIINKFQPETVIMVGICGGRCGEVQLGDLIIADVSWDYASGKIKDKSEGGFELLPQPHQINIKPMIKSFVQKNEGLIHDIYKKWNLDKHQSKSSNLKIGALASGASVISSEDFYEQIIFPQHRKFLGIDMESYGVYFACENSNDQIKFISIKAVSDLANVEKDDTYHEYCSYISSMFAYKLLELGTML